MQELERKALSLREGLHVLQQLAARAGHAPEDGLWVGRKLTLSNKSRPLIVSLPQRYLTLDSFRWSGQRVAPIHRRP